MLASLKLETLQDVPVARLAGEVDSSNARHLGASLVDAVPNQAMGMVLDLSDTTYLDSSGIQLLFELAGRLSRRQQELRIVVPAESFVADVLAAVNLAGVAQMDATVHEALTALNGAAT
jgi:anti-sigma B factor antagonist